MNYSFLVGTHRSGTTWLGSLIGRLPAVSYWSEPRQVWSYGHYRKVDDVLGKEDAKPEIKNHIRSRFAQYASLRGCDHFVEKTPNNCLRVDFMNEVFPEGKFLLLLRDGRAVLRSTNEIQTRGVTWGRIAERLSEVSIKELPAYLDRVPWVWQRLLGRKLKYWGARPRDWQQWSQSMSPLQVIARQWSDSIMAAKVSFERIPTDRKLILRYEDIVKSPGSELERILNFLEIQDDSKVIENAISSSRPETLLKWRNELSQESLQEVRSIVQPTLETLGYEW